MNTHWLGQVLNFHTAYYDDSGDLQGVREGEGGEGPKADLQAMYTNYLRGCVHGK